MKRTMRMIALAIAALMLIGTIAGCTKTETLEIPPPYENDPDDETIRIDLSLQMVPLAELPAMFSNMTPTAPGTSTKANSKAIIDYSNSADGYVMIKYVNKTDKGLKVLITGPSGVQYQYNLRKDAQYEVYPLSDGNGKYTIGVYENVSGNRYASAVSGQIQVKLSDQFAPFLRPNQFVNFNSDSKVVAKAAELVKNAADFKAKVKAIYDFVITNIKYDKELADSVQAGYVPNVDAVMEKGKGICFDYAAVMAAMLRSQGIPTKLVIGYAGSAYHAWIDVYSEEEGWLDSYIFFDGQTWKLMDPTFVSTGGAAGAKYVGNGSNYSARFLY